MTSKIYALLVGIDNYAAPVTPLQGCVNDVMAMEEYLRSRVIGEGWELDLKILKDEQATRQAIIDGFREHLCQAASNDVALFQYSGHGSQEKAPPEFWDLEPDKLNETLVCYDSRLEGSWDLADKELAKLISEVAEKNPQIALILDCCHSGAGSRDLLQETAVRENAKDERFRPLNSFILSPEEIENLITVKKTSGWSLPRGKHILFASCQNSEKAKEFVADGKRRGAFSYFLTQTLNKAKGNLTYRDLFKQTNASVRSKYYNQSPQLETIDSKDLDQYFLGGGISDRHPYYTVSDHKQYGWIIDGGALHGVPRGDGEEMMQLALFPIETQGKDLRKLSNKIAAAQVTEVLPQLSKITISPNFDAQTEQTFKAVITSLPLPPKTVRFGVGYSRNGKTEIRIERLPEPENIRERDLTGALRIFFHKIASEKLGLEQLGLEYSYPLLGVANVAIDETISYELDPEKVKQQVAQAEKIVLYIHGITGDTLSMLPSMQRAKVEVEGQEKSLAQMYDLILSFDYENLHTSIEENARLLKQRLEAVGLGENHGKQLQIVAHSMGGLISRWFIEREGGNQIVNHLIMLGTPNAGSPWAKIEDWAIMSIALGLNSLSTTALPVKILGSLVATVETIDISLDQMRIGSDFLKSLANSPDPGIPYSIIAGNNSISSTTIETGKLQRLIYKLRNISIDLAFFGQPNDIAVSMNSITNVNRIPQPQIYQVGSDHNSYFSDTEGLTALARALMENQKKSHPPVSDSSKDSKKNKTRKNWGWLISLIIALLGLTSITGWSILQQSVNVQPLNQEHIQSHN